ncbi:efflux RND transporter periplasmic adaptor subunit [Cytophaga aurantiaca]|uniref:efflux RND transporter periplasmic adaptor subunit n=1 Tax=Cytophaga aurantiaca TaxID=29530 RepID=UPI00037B48F8|nr:efflux RND transporter periplasmic adaptor subunit [Cytophaga aurantiaca]
MKNRTYTYLGLGLLALTFACSAPDKKAELEKLKSEQSSLSEKIKALEEEIKKTDTTDATKYIVVGFEAVKKAPFVHYIQVQGKIDSDKNVQISSTIGGSVEKIYVVKGQSVQKGALLAKTDGEQILKGIQEIDKALELANQLYDKQKRLWDQQIGTEVQYLQAKNQKESLESRKATLQEQYSQTSIRAPFAGVIDEVYAKEGQMLAPGYPAFRLVNANDVKLVANISESYVKNVRVGQEAVVTFPDLKKDVKTRVTVVGDVIDPINRTFQVDLGLKQDQNLLKANMISYIKIKDYTNPSIVVIPMNLVQRNNDKNYVYVVDGTVSAKRFITLGQHYENSVEVLDGLKEGDKLITIGYQDLVEGQPIKFE